VYREIVLDTNSGQFLPGAQSSFIDHVRFGDRSILEHQGLLGESDTFTVEWRGNFYFDAGARYRFFTESDDGSWLFLPDVQGWDPVINNGGRHPRQLREFFYTFPTSGWRRVQINFFEDGGGEYLRAGFERIAQCDLGSPRNRFDGCVFDEPNFNQDRFITKTESVMPINIDQTLVGRSENFSVVYRGHFESFNGRYRFWTASDDGSTVDIRRPDGSGYRLILDNNDFRGGARREEIVDLTGGNAGDYIVQVHYFERTGNAFLNAGWEKLELCDASFPRDRFHGCAFAGTPYFDENRLYHQYDTTGGPSTITISESLGGRSDQFSTTLRGKFNFPRGRYKFWTDSDDGSWMYVWKDGSAQQRVIDNGGDHGRRRVENIEFLEGGDYLVQVNFYENGGAAYLGFGWDAFRCDEGMNPQNTFVGCVFDGKDFDRGLFAGNISEPGVPSPVGSHTAFTENWGGGGPLGRSDNFSVIWFGNINFSPGGYRFFTSSDDGSYLDMDGLGRIVDNGGDHGTQTRYSGWHNLSGVHRLVSHFYENGGGAYMQIGWEQDVSGPSVSIDQPNGVVNGTSLSIALSFSDTQSGVAEGDVDVRINEGSWVNDNLPNGGSLTANFTYSATVGNRYEFRFRARDNAGNWSGYVYDGKVAINAPPRAPTGLSPTGGVNTLDVAPTAPLNPILRWSDFSDPDTASAHNVGGSGAHADADTQTASHVQIATDSGFNTLRCGGNESSLCFQASSINNLRVPNNVLAYNQTYFWRVKVRDPHGVDSPWSRIASFITPPSSPPCPGSPAEPVPGCGPTPPPVCEESGSTIVCDGGDPDPTGSRPGPTDYTDPINCPTGGCSLVECRWNFGDGTPIIIDASCTDQIHSYTTPGTYTVTITVKDNHGQSVTTSGTVRVRGTPRFREIPPQ